MTLRRILFSSALALFTSGAISSAALATSAQPPSLNELEPPRHMSINEAESGTLMFQTDTRGRYVKAPMVATDVKMDIAGPIIRTTLSQTFENTSDQWVEGIYVFPLPENAAVDHLRMIIGGRLIEGQIKEKVKAKKIYEQAKAEGKKASLIEQERPNIFTASVANIGPHETIAIQIEYQDKAAIKDGVFSTHLPLTVAPRFSPPAQTVKVATTEGLHNIVFDPVLDRKAITPPVMQPQDEPINYLRLPVSIDINLEAGFDIAAVKSAYHAVTTTQLDKDSAHIRLTEGEIPANRDFKLEWRAQETLKPYSAVFKQTLGDETYLLSMLTPPKADAADIKTRPREVIFVIDTSGSMGGRSIEQAQQSLLIALDRLGPKDNFNIIRFSSDHTSFDSKPITATAENIAQAQRWVRRLKAGGGTQMSPALTTALTANTRDKTRLRQVIFITDGAIGNEQQLFAQIQDQLGDSRLFPVGIGAAPNRFFMSRAAKFGRGTFVHIGDISEVSKHMKVLLNAIESPVLTDVKSSVTGTSFPAKSPDVYQGDPVISITKVKTNELPKTITLSGQIAGGTWQDTQDISQAEDAIGLSVLWGRAKIAGLEESRFDRANAANIDAQILQTALDHHIVSRLTSLVAVDITPSRPLENILGRAPVPTMLPKGWDFGKGATSESRSSAHSAGQQNPKQSLRPANTPRSNLALPRTASAHQMLAFIGILSLLLGLLMKHANRRRILLQRAIFRRIEIF